MIQDSSQDLKYFKSLEYREILSLLAQSKHRDVSKIQDSASLVQDLRFKERFECC